MHGLIELLIVIVVVGLVAGIFVWVVDQLPFFAPPFRQIARVLVLLIAALVILMKALPLLGVSLG